MYLGLGINPSFTQLGARCLPRCDHLYWLLLLHRKGNAIPNFHHHAIKLICDGFDVGVMNSGRGDPVDVGRTRSIFVRQVGDVDRLPAILEIKGVPAAQRMGLRVLVFYFGRGVLFTWQIRGKCNIEGSKNHHEDSPGVVAHDVCGGLDWRDRFRDDLVWVGRRDRKALGYWLG